MSVKMNVICNFFIVVAIFATIALPPESSFCFERNLLEENQADSPLQVENPPSLANGHVHSNNSGEISVTSGSEELGMTEDMASANFIENVPGPGAFLGIMLRQLTIACSQSDDRIKKLIAGIPQVIPDLNKVLVTL